jgi:hypothetical protein
MGTRGIKIDAKNHAPPNRPSGLFTSVAIDGFYQASHSSFVNILFLFIIHDKT